MDAIMTYEQLADREGLTGALRARFIYYMRHRIFDESSVCRYNYGMVWVDRFKRGEEYSCSDSAGQELLDQMNSLKFS